MKRLCCLLLLLAVPVMAGPPVIDWQRTLDGAFWSWSERETTPLFCATNQSDVPVTLAVVKDRGQIEMTVGSFKFTGHDRTVFHATGGKLYYAKFHPSSSGATIVAVDLATGKTLWESPVQGIGPVQHSAYANHLNLRAGNDVVQITGRESMGLYMEFKQLSDGKSVANRVFSKTYQRYATDAFLFAEPMNGAFLIQVPEMDRALSSLLSDTELAFKRQGRELPAPQGQDIRDVWRQQILATYPHLLCVREDQIEHGTAQFNAEQSRARIEKLLTTWKERRAELPAHTQVAVEQYLSGEKPKTDPNARLELLARLLTIADAVAEKPATQPAGEWP